MGGHTKSDNFPPYGSGTFFSIYPSKFSADGSELRYTQLWDTTTPAGQAVTVDARGDVYLAGTFDTLPELFIAKLRDSGYVRPGDANWDGEIDFGDINPFVGLLSGA